MYTRYQKNEDDILQTPVTASDFRPHTTKSCHQGLCNWQEESIRMCMAEMDRLGGAYTWAVELHDWGLQMVTCCLEEITHGRAELRVAAPG